jgi:hypothetical protein
MYNGLKYIQHIFPYFFDFSEGTNNEKLSKIIHHNFKELLNSVEAIRNSYYFYNNDAGSYLESNYSPVVADDTNEISLITSEVDEGSSIKFTSDLFGDLGSDDLKAIDVLSEFNEHISIIRNNLLGDAYNFTLKVLAKDIKDIEIDNLDTGNVNFVSFDYDEHVNSYMTNIPISEDDYKITVNTWEEYTYVSYTNKINIDLDIIGNLVGCKRRDYKIVN